MLRGYVGTYYADSTSGVYEFSLDESTGIFTDNVLLCNLKDSKYLTYNNGHIISIYKKNEDEAGVFICDEKGKEVASLIYEKTPSCYVSYEKKHIYTANFHEGTVSKLSYNNNILELINKFEAGEGAGCHQVLVYKNMFVVPCLNKDELVVLSEDLSKIGSVRFNNKTGPRHGVFVGDHLYLLCELSNELYVLRYKNNSFEIIHNIKIADCLFGAAAIRLSEDKKKLYISVREENVFVSVDISNKIPTIIGTARLSGNHPRDIINISNDKFLLVANRYSSELLCYELHDNTIGRCLSGVHIEECVSICLRQ